MIVTNISDFDRGIREGVESLFKHAGGQIAGALSVAFEELVRETPQWSGTTAASWSLGLRNIAHPPTIYPKVSEDEAMSRGMSPAVDHALVNGLQSLPLDLRGYGSADILLVNNSPNLHYAMNGPLREINGEPGAALRQFEYTVISVLDSLK